MTEKRSFSLYTYSSWFLVLSMVGFGALGTGSLFIFQRILEIPAWIQYISLTLWLAADFLFSGYAAAKPTVIKLNDRELILETNLETVTVLWEDVLSYKISDKLLLISNKIKLRNEETISIIDFKWRGNENFYAFLQASYPFQSEDTTEDIPDSGNAGRSFIQNNLKTILGVIFFMVYVNISSNLDDRGAFYTWNPIALYFYWVIPVLIFFKMVFTQNNS